MGMGCNGLWGELTLTPRQQVLLYHSKCTLSRKQQKSPYHHNFHPTPSNLFLARSCPRIRVYCPAKAGPGAGVGTSVIRAGCTGQPEREGPGGQLSEAGGEQEGDGDVLFTTRSPQPHSQTGTSASSPGVCPLQREPRGCAVT